MDGTQIRIKLFLESLGISSDVSTLQNRVCIQKAIYLAQQAGADLGYSYSWYVHGPYSPELTTDYFELDNNLSTGDEDYKKYKLIPSLSKPLQRINGLFTVPQEVNLSQDRWLELISSIIYWGKTLGNEKITRERIKKEKSDLSIYYPQATKMIKKYGLLEF
jgi:uncharacterized protein YwgA